MCWIPTEKGTTYLLWMFWLRTMSERIGDIELCGRLRGLVDSVLNEREARIIRLRYGLAGAAPMTQRETAKVCSISRSYVSRLEKKALEKLRSELGDDAYI